MQELPGHLLEKYRMYAIQLDSGVNKRPGQTLIMVHVGRPISFETFCSEFVFRNIELTIEKTGEKIPVTSITGIQKIPNQNVPDYELIYDGILKEISK